ncbi:hypothetical protein [Azovibrio restrictus]|jgi:hypothetical protein|uniref:hypothetical protein n=1 Tax=Azovibrio restrictus TaxID=146938 RepID=UPI0026EE43DF|nr:hypothetical protein [Azovibrio restrictus]
MSPRFLPLFLLPLLAACVNDGAAYMVDGPQHALSVVREQNLFWEKQVELAVVVSRLPDCQRKHVIQKAAPSVPVELWQPGPGTFILQVGQNRYVTETRTCQGFARMTEDPPGGMGEKLGTYAVRNGVFTFTPAARAEGADPSSSAR